MSKSLGRPTFQTGVFSANHAITMLTLGDHIVANNTVQLLTNPPSDIKPKYDTDVLFAEGSIQPTINLIEALSLHTRVSEKMYLNTLNYLSKFKYFMNQTYEHCGLKPLFISIINNKPTITAYDYVVSICEWCTYPEIIIDKELVAKVRGEIPTYSEGCLDKLGMSTQLLVGPAYEGIHSQVIAAHLQKTRGTCPKKWYII